MDDSVLFDKLSSVLDLIHDCTARCLNELRHAPAATGVVPWGETNS